LPNLCKIDGVVMGGATGLQELDLPALTFAGAISLNASSLATLTVPNLAAVPGGLQVYGGGSATASFDFPSLTTAGPNFTISVNQAASVSAPFTTCPSVLVAGVTTATFGALSSASGGLNFQTPGTGTLNVPLLANSGQLTLQMSGPGTLTLNAPLYASLNGGLYLNTMGPGTNTITLNAPLLSSVSLLSLVPVGAASTLITLNAPQLANVSDLEVASAGSLSLNGIVTVGKGTINAFQTFSAPNLVTAGTSGGSVTLRLVSGVDLSKLASTSLFVADTSLVTLDLPALTSGSVTLGAVPGPNILSTCSFAGSCMLNGPTGNPFLVQLTAPQWTSGNVLFYAPAFPKCRADALLTQLGVPAQNFSSYECCSMASSPCP
jgi:hypothetical protein